MSESVRPPWEFEDPVCAEVGTEIFFGKDQDELHMLSNRIPQDTYKDAKAICQTCKHLLECADWGIENEVHGVWGGLSPLDRKKIRSRLQLRGRGRPSNSQIAQIPPRAS